MIKIFNCFTEKDKKKLELFLENRRSIDLKNVKKVNKIIEDIKRNKLKALLRYEKKFSKNKELKPSKAKIKNSIKKLNPKVKKAIDFAYERIVKFHAAQLKTLKDVKYIDKYKNKMEYKTIPIESVGIYVPGNLPSTLLMNSVPAKLAKVKRIILATPKVNGKLNPGVLYAAKKVGIKDIYSIGGAQAIASLAFI